MDELLSVLGWVLLGVMIGGFSFFMVRRNLARKTTSRNRVLVASLCDSHFRPLTFDDITITEREFPFHMRVDLQRNIDRLFGDASKILHLCGVRKDYDHGGVALTDCIADSPNNPVSSVSLQYEEVDIGEEQPVKCLKNGLWFLEEDANRYLVFLSSVAKYASCGMVESLVIQVATPNTPAGTQVVQEFFKRLEKSVLEAESYRGKILCLEQTENSYSGESTGIKVLKLRTVARDQIILPQKTLDLLDRNVIQFVNQRPQLAKYRQATKKGILFYGPPGTGKTHTLHYLAKALKGHTTFLITAEQVGLLSQYMTLARLLQPSIVVIEDADLVARERSSMDSMEEVLLNKLLNEMDGLKEEADILFILTTNRPESLEGALASRPGRIDQAIEFPLPDDEGRRKLVRLYSQGVAVPEEVVSATVLKTDGANAAFIKELMRRSVQFHLEREGTGNIQLQDVENAIDEMLFSGGSLNRKLLGAGEMDDLSDR